MAIKSLPLAKSIQLSVDVFRSEDSSEAESQSEDPWPSNQRIESWAHQCISHHESGQRLQIDGGSTNPSRPVLSEAAKSIGLSVALVSCEEIQQLNKQFRAKDYATNVLSFPQQIDPEELPAFSEMAHSPLGEIVLCGEVIAREAREQGKTLESHWAHMTIHGTLHLLGYDHLEDEDAECMESLEKTLLAELGIEDPYKQIATTLNPDQISH